ncbi:hypothetical protein K445DRAFT_362763 [Daldinia sp. EC12]|nr:hypothetical protein K445DRAFT_362763 [Daldinia sp. EC12]
MGRWARSSHPKDGSKNDATNESPQPSTPDWSKRSDWDDWVHVGPGSVSDGYVQVDENDPHWAWRASSSRGEYSGELMLRRLQELATELEHQKEFDYPGAMKKVFGGHAGNLVVVFNVASRRLWVQPRPVSQDIARPGWSSFNRVLTTAESCRDVANLLLSASASSASGEGKAGKKAPAMDAHSPDDVD